MINSLSCTTLTVVVYVHVSMSSTVMLIATLTHRVPVHTGHFFQLPHDQRPFMYNFDCSFLCKDELNSHVGCNFKINTHGTC